MSKSPQQTLPPPSPDKAEEIQHLARSIEMMERIIDKAIDPNFAATPEQLRDVAEMVLTDMMFRKVTADFWMANAPPVLTLISLCEQVSAEARMSVVEGVGETAKATFRAAINLSVKQVTESRKKLAPIIKAIKDCPMPGTTVH